MEINVSIPPASNFDWGGKYYALLSRGVGSSRVISVGLSPSEAKQNKIDDIQANSMATQEMKDKMCRYISYTEINRPESQHFHSYMSYHIQECDFKTYYYFNKNKTVRFIYLNGNEPIKIKFLGV